MANKYRSVLASSGTQPTGNAVPADVLSGKTFSNADGINKVGTMVNRGAVSGTATPSQPYTIPAGYHNGNGVVTADGVSFKEMAGYRFEAGVGNFSLFTSMTHNVYVSGGSGAVVYANSEYFESTTPSGIGGVLKAKKNCTILHLENDSVVGTQAYSAGDTIFTYPTGNVQTTYHNWIVV